MIKKLILLIFIAGMQIVFSQEDYNAFSIPIELKKNANAVVRESNTLIELNSLKEMVITERRVVTILNRFGDKHSDTRAYYDDSNKILKISALILDASGNEIKKNKSSDFKDVSAVTGGQMYTNNRVKYLDYKPISYPYTIVFECKIKEKSTAFIKSWYPVEGYYVSVEKSSYEFINHTTSEHKYKSYNSSFVDFKITNEENRLIFKTENLKAVEQEERSPSFNEVFPRVVVAMEDFFLKGVKGNSKDWKSFGLWQFNDLLTDRDELEDETVTELSELLVNVSSKKEKIKIVYNYMQDRTRYVGVQLGIGGWQPITAREVDKVKYGDCKGLTNYTKALLKSQGIESYYTIVYAGAKRDIDNQFSSLQGNHVILNVPLEEEDVWLECTSQTMPFNFLGDFTDDRDVLVVTPNGGVIKHTPVYGEEMNTLTTSAKIVIEPNGRVKAVVDLKSKGLQYDERVYLASLSEEKKELVYLDRWGCLNGLKIEKIEVNEDKNIIELREKVSLVVENYVTKIGEKYLIQFNMFNRQTSLPLTYEDRSLPFKTGMSFKDFDVYEFQLPLGMKVDSLPGDFMVESEFGTYEISFELNNDNRILYKRELMIKGGGYSSIKYAEYRSFIKKIKKKDKLKFVIKNSKI